MNMAEQPLQTEDNPITPAAGAAVRKSGARPLAGFANMAPAPLQPYLPMDLIGGTLPHVPGLEDEAVWNAAAQACGEQAAG